MNNQELLPIRIVYVQADVEEIDPVALRSVFLEYRSSAPDVRLVVQSRKARLTDSKPIELLIRGLIQPVAVSPCVSTVAGLLGNYSPKTPFVLPHLMVINPHRCAELGIFDEPWPLHTHFSEWGELQAHWIRFLEGRVPYGEVIPLWEGDLRVRNRFGEPVVPNQSAVWYSEVLSLFSVGKRVNTKDRAWAGQSLVQYFKRPWPHRVFRRVRKYLDKLAFSTFSSEMHRDGRNFAI